MPEITIKKTINRIAHFSVLDPTHNYYYNDYRGYNKQPPFIKSQTHKKLIPYRIIYTLLIYFVCFFGVIYFFKQKNYQLLLLFLLSILYYIIILGWTGMTRLFVPNLIYLSFFFGNELYHYYQWFVVPSFWVLTIVTFIEVWLFFYILSNSGAVFINLGSYLVMPAGFVWGYIFFGETFTLTKFISSLFIVISIFLVGNQKYKIRNTPLA